MMIRFSPVKLYFDSFYGGSGFNLSGNCGRCKSAGLKNELKTEGDFLLLLSICFVS